MKSIGQIHHDTETKALVDLGYPLDSTKTWPECLEDGADKPIEAGALAVLLHALDALSMPGVQASEAAVRLRRGETLEQICEAGNKPSREPCGPACNIFCEATVEHKDRRHEQAIKSPPPQKCHDHTPEPGAYGVCKRCGSEVPATRRPDSRDADLPGPPRKGPL